jgi:hypothetical protein
MSKVAVVAVKYLEPEYVQTIECIQALNVPVFYVDREGIGSLSMAINKGFNNNELTQFKYVWFLTNIIFEASVLQQLVDEMERTGFTAIHPCFESDHRHIRPIAKLNSIREVPFIEFTAPMIRTNVFELFQLDEDMPYWGQDLDWSYRVRSKGCKLGVHYGARVDHTYIRNNKNDHPVTEARKRLRNMTDDMTRQKLISKYGNNWKKTVWPS